MNDQAPFDDVLSEALQARASEVSASPDDDARQGVEQRIRQRVRARRQRRALVSVTSAVAAVAVVVGAVTLVDRGDSDSDGSDVAIQGPDTTVGPSLEPGAAGDDPEAFALPRLGFAAELDLHAQDVAPEVVRATTADATRFRQMQVFHRPGASLPVIVAPWPVAAPDLAAHTPVRVGGQDGWLMASPGGFTALTWTTAAGTTAHVYGQGITADELVAFAAGATVGDDGVVLEPGPVPEGFAGETLEAPATDDVIAVYELGFRPSDDPDVLVSLEVRHDSAEEQAERMLKALETGTTGEQLTVMGTPGLLVHYAEPDAWTVGWSPEEGVTAFMFITGGATRAEVEAIVDGLQILSAAQWDAALAGG